VTFVSNSSNGSPIFDYSSRDYSSIMQDLLNRVPNYLPEWTSQDPSDFGVVLLQLFAYVGDLLSYYEDRLAGEAFIQTATQPVSVLNIAAMLGYTPTLTVPASAELQVTIGSTVTGPFVIPQGTKFSTVASTTQPAIVFETAAELIIAGASAATPSVNGTVLVLQGTTYANEQVATSDGSVNQLYPLANSPVLSDSFQVFVDLGQGPQLWSYVSSLIDYGPLDSVYTNFVDAQGTFYIVFGDNVNGYVPPLGSPITATYRVGNGSAGNVGAGTIIEPVGTNPGIIAVTNVLAANGGADAESLQSIRQNAPASLRTLSRAVTVSDIETLALAVPGVEWASANQQTYQLVNLYICPFGGGNPTAAMSAAVQAALGPGVVMANTTVTLQNPTYVPINITVTVYVLDNYGNLSTQTAVEAALTNLLALPNTGFGFRVSLGAVYTAILQTPGVNYAFVTSLARYGVATLTAPLTSGDTYTSLLVSPLPSLINSGDTVQVTNSANQTQNFTVTSYVGPGATSIPVTSQLMSDTFVVGDWVTDTTTTTADAVLLDNEIPVVGTLTVTADGGVSGD